MRIYQAKSKKFHGTDFHEVRKKAFGLYQEITKRTKRRPYVRSAYFKKDKVFLALFWQHLWGKQKWQDRMRRLKFFAAEKELFFVQIKENKRTGQKYLISIFPSG